MKCELNTKGLVVEYLLGRQKFPSSIPDYLQWKDLAGDMKDLSLIPAL